MKKTIVHYLDCSRDGKKIAPRVWEMMGSYFDIDREDMEICRFRNTQFISHNYGAYSHYYRISRNRGLKCFDNEDDAFYCRHSQVEFAKRKLAPQVYSKIIRVLVWSKKRWHIFYAYITQVAIIFGEKYKQLRRKKREYNEKYSRSLDYFLEKLDKHCKRSKILKRCSGVVEDDHEWNFGYIGNRLVWIDFS